MRTLTITREKSFVACLGTDKVYIEDPAAAELTISGVPCRKLGDLKNGKTVTFEIDNAQRQIFLIADELSKEYCNASVTIPAGEEPVTLSGKHHFVLGSNPFRFDGVEMTEEQIRQQKKNGKKGLVIFICAILVGGVVGGLLGGLAGSSTAKSEAPKTFEKGELSITLTDSFREVQEDGFFAVYESNEAAVLVIREADEGDNLTVEEYAQLVMETNDRADLKANRAENYIWFEFVSEVGELQMYYLAACYCSEDAYWVINFAAPIGMQDEYEQIFRDWADTVSFEQ